MRKPIGLPKQQYFDILYFGNRKAPRGLNPRGVSLCLCICFLHHEQHISRSYVFITAFDSVRCLRFYLLPLIFPLPVLLFAVLKLPAAFLLSAVFCLTLSVLRPFQNRLCAAAVFIFQYSFVLFPFQCFTVSQSGFFLHHSVFFPVLRLSVPRFPPFCVLPRPAFFPFCVLPVPRFPFCVLPVPRFPRSVFSRVPCSSTFCVFPRSMLSPFCVLPHSAAAYPFLPLSPALCRSLSVFSAL